MSSLVFDTYEIDDDKGRLDVAFVHEQLSLSDVIVAE
jgi:hypothetical protein